MAGDINGFLVLAGLGDFHAGLGLVKVFAKRQFLPLLFQIFIAFTIKIFGLLAILVVRVMVRVMVRVPGPAKVSPDALPLRPIAALLPSRLLVG